MSLRSDDEPVPRKTRSSFLWIVGGISLLLVGGGYWYLTSLQNPQIRFKTAAVKMGTIARVVTATGTVEPVLSVEVGSEVSGTIQSLHADFNSIVSAGDLLARIDPKPFQARREQEGASLLSAKARLAQAGAELALTKRDLTRAKALLEQGFISQADLDVEQTNYESAVAQVDLHRALVNQATAGVEAAQLGLDHTVIYSPIDGTVIDRKVSAGQTVAASFQTPALFIIAEDLTRMRVIAYVGEADIAEVADQQDVTFRVDAYPAMTFDGLVTQVRIGSKEDQDVVTYDVAIDVDNPELLLKPGMTTDVEIVVEAIRDILTVPNVALRFSPPETGDGNDGAIAKTRKNQGQRGTRVDSRSIVWVPETDGTPTQLTVGTGLADSQFTQITEGSLKQGDLVIVGIEPHSDGDDGLALPPWFR